MKLKNLKKLIKEYSKQLKEQNTTYVGPNCLYVSSPSTTSLPSEEFITFFNNWIGGGFDLTAETYCSICETVPEQLVSIPSSQEACVCCEGPTYIVYGCMDDLASNYNPNANSPDPSDNCEYNDPSPQYSCGGCGGCVEDPDGIFSSWDECNQSGCSPSINETLWNQTPFVTKENFCGRCYIAYPNTQNMAEQTNLPSCNWCCSEGVELVSYFSSFNSNGAVIPEPPNDSFNCYEYLRPEPNNGDSSDECSGFNNSTSEQQNAICEYITLGVNGPEYNNLEPSEAVIMLNSLLSFTNNGECCPGDVNLILGCTDNTALNYNPEAFIPDNSCEYQDCDNFNLMIQSFQDVICNGCPNPQQAMCACCEADIPSTLEPTLEPTTVATPIPTKTKPIEDPQVVRMQKLANIEKTFKNKEF